jgi:hypothetical protein|tara:strand:- start:485 stop:769 length:285 start_codon:yes stop_codon:yes gene_type:complete
LDQKIKEGALRGAFFLFKITMKKKAGIFILSLYWCFIIVASLSLISCSKHTHTDIWYGIKAKIEYYKTLPPAIKEKMRKADEESWQEVDTNTTK